MAVTRVVMPKLSEAMETGKVIKWLKREGERVEGGDIIAEIETDKADIELESFGAGVLRKIVVSEGERAPVGELIAVIAEASEDIAGLLAGRTAPTPTAPAGAASVPAPATAGPRPVPVGREAGGRVGDQSREAGGRVGDQSRATVGRAADKSGRVKASPLAKKIAARSGVDLSVVEGSGPGGRIIRRDVEAATSVGEGAAARGAGVAPAREPAPAEVEFEDRALSSIRGAIARRMVQAKGPVPHFYLTTEINVERAWRIREELNSIEGHPKVSVTDMIVRACALALTKHPGVNASFQGEALRVHHRCHIGIAVALDEGLITPVLRDCHKKSLAQIAVESKDLVERSRNRKLRAQEISGATFSVSNLGMFDVDEFSAIINPPEGAILAVGAVLTKPVVEGERIGIGRRMRLTLSCDHRVMDGAMGARFLQDLRRLLEEPVRLLI